MDSRLDPSRATKRSKAERDAARGRRLAPALVFLLVCATGGCARAVNYLDPQGPRYEYQAARPSERSADVTFGPLRQVVPFRVVSFNIEYALRVDRAIDLLRETAPLRGADALLLQEMDAPAVERIAAALGMNGLFFPSGVHPKHRRDFGCAVLSPWRLECPRKLVLPHGARVSGLRRSAVSAVVVRGQERVRVYSVHLPSPLGVSRASRRDQVRALIEDAEGAAGPIVIGGDFNSHAIGSLLVQAGYLWVTQANGPSTADGKRYDHVFARGLSQGAVATGVVEDNRESSDHKPVWATFVPDDSALHPGGACR